MYVCVGSVTPRESPLHPHSLPHPLRSRWVVFYFLLCHCYSGSIFRFVSDCLLCLRQGMCSISTHWNSTPICTKPCLRYMQVTSSLHLDKLQWSDSNIFDKGEKKQTVVFFCVWGTNELGVWQAQQTRTRASCCSVWTWCWASAGSRSACSEPRLSSRDSTLSLCMWCTTRVWASWHLTGHSSMWDHSVFIISTYSTYTMNTLLHEFCFVLMQEINFVFAIQMPK